MQQEDFDEPIDDYDFEEPQFSPQCSAQDKVVEPLRPQVFTAFDLFCLLKSELNCNLLDMYPFLNIISAVALVVQNNFRIDIIKEKLLGYQKEGDLQRIFNFPQLVETKSRECIICCQLEEKLMKVCCNSICSSCLSRTLWEEIVNNRLSLRCPNKPCNKLVLYNVLPTKEGCRYEQKVGMMWAKSQRNQFLQCFDCELFIKIPRNAKAMTMCNESCACKMCIDCHQLSHRPVRCQDVKKWTGKIIESGLNQKYLREKTKQCPKCNVHIEKNEGCNHMTCRHCKHQFCWICFVDWVTHCSAGFKGCAAYQKKKETTQQIEDKQRFYFYCERFLNYQQSEQKAFLKKKKLQNEYLSMLEVATEAPKGDYDFFLLGVNCIIQSRRLMKYIFAHICMAKLPKNRQDLIDYNIAQAQTNIEHLQGVIQSAMNSNGVMEKEEYHKLRIDIKNYSSVTDAFLEKIVKDLD